MGKIIRLSILSVLYTNTLGTSYYLIFSVGAEEKIFSLSRTFDLQCTLHTRGNTSHFTFMNVCSDLSK